MKAPPPGQIRIVSHPAEADGEVANVIVVIHPPPFASGRTPPPSSAPIYPELKAVAPGIIASDGKD